MIDQTIGWIHRHTLPGQGIAVHNRKPVCYPEVTGYLIPTLVANGERALARQYARWLCSIQRPDGAFSDPEGILAYAFDTGQAIRGWAALLADLPELESPLRRACDWMLAAADPATGRLPVPQGGAWAMGPRGTVSEGVHLYALVPLRQAGESLQEPRYLDFVDRSKRYYLENLDLTGFEQRHMLTHLFCYIQEALFDLGEPALAARGMEGLARYQQDNGALPGFSDVPWVCAPGQMQAALVWYKLGQRDRADRALAFIEPWRNPSGGFFGSFGAAAAYFPSAELSWAAKFFLDASAARITRFFDAEQAAFPATLAPDDGRLAAILAAAGNLDGKRVLDVGCGKGRFAAVIKARFPHAEMVGVDISAELLKAVPPGITTRQGNMLELPWPDSSFDMVYCVEALEHAQRLEVALRELCRVLRPGGRLVIIDKNARRWGAFATPVWEQWFDPDDLARRLRQDCDAIEWKFIPYDRKRTADGVFVAWTARRRGAPTAASPSPSPAPNQALNAEQWHEAIVAGARPAEIAARVRAGRVPEWVRPILDLTHSGQVVLELGSGTAALSAFLAREGREVVLLDYSQASLDFGLEVFRELGMAAPQTLCADIRRPLPCDTGSVDFVWSSGVLEHFADDEIVHILRESARVARRGVLSLVPNARSLAYRLGKWDQEQNGRWRYGAEDPKHSLAPLFERAGLRDVRESTLAPLHALTFLDGPALAPARQALDRFLRALAPEDLEVLGQGYLLATVGRVQPPRRLAVIPSDPLAAYERAGYGDWLAAYYNPAGCFDEVYCLSPKETEPRFAHGMRVVPTTAEQFAPRLRELRIDVVRAYGGYWACDLATAHRVPGVPVVVSVHDARPEWLHDSIRGADRVLAVSDTLRRLVEHRGVPADRIVIVPNRVDFDVFRRVEDPAKRADFEGRFPGRFRLLHVGRRSREKNLDTLLRALPWLGPDYSLIAVGRGDPEPYLRLAGELQVRPRCHFLEAVPSRDLPVFYSCCDCFCTPSRHEGFGIVFLEALACEAVVVTSDLPPMTEFVREGENGLLVKDFENPEALAAAIRLACTDDSLRATLRGAARESVRRFERRRVDAIEAAFYRDVLSPAAKSLPP